MAQPAPHSRVETEPLPPHILAVLPRTSHLASLSLSVHFYKEVIIIPASQRRSTVPSPEQGQGHLLWRQGLRRQVPARSGGGAGLVVPRLFRDIETWGASSPVQALPSAQQQRGKPEGGLPSPERDTKRRSRRWPGPGVASHSCPLSQPRPLPPGCARWGLAAQLECFLFWGK